jgi:hypothetical protein
VKLAMLPALGDGRAPGRELGAQVNGVPYSVLNARRYRERALGDAHELPALGSNVQDLGTSIRWGSERPRAPLGLPTRAHTGDLVRRARGALGSIRWVIAGAHEKNDCSAGMLWA